MHMDNGRTYNLPTETIKYHWYTMQYKTMVLLFQTIFLIFLNAPFALLACRNSALKCTHAV